MSTTVAVSRLISPADSAWSMNASGKSRPRAGVLPAHQCLDALDLAVLVASVPDEGAKAALLAAEPDLYFTTAHFDGWAAVLVRLDRLDARSLHELAAEAWPARAPRRLVAEHPLPS
jgi:hypothetical protein